MVVAIFLEQPFGLLDRAGQVRSLARDEIRVERVQRLTESVIIKRQRAQRERAAGEWDQADAIAFQAGHKIDDAEARAFQAVGSEVLGQHAARGIHGEKNIDAPAFHLMPLEALSRPGDRHEHQPHRQQPQPAFEIPQPWRESLGQTQPEPRMNHLGKIRLAAPIEAHEQSDDARAHHRTGNDPVRLGEMQ